MSQGIVYKQWYKSANLSTTPTLNVKHLEYIATRKGAIRNPGCSFGLWGKLQAHDEAANINDLRNAKKMVRTASKGHTIYRAVLSVDDETASAHDLYSRGAWQNLVTEKISVFAKEMNIDEKDFRWVASMHYVKGHPHVHIMYWDNSSKVRQEFIPKERFEIMAEHVRAAFGRELFQDEIRSLDNAADAVLKEARLELKALCRETNVAQALNLNHVTAAQLNSLGQELAALAIAMPPKGALKYAYLSSEYKAQMNEFIDHILKITDFRKIEQQYLRLTDQISAFYGNGEEKATFNRDRARQKLYTGMGNSILSCLKEVRDELLETAPRELEELKLVIQSTTRIILSNSPRYYDLLHSMPKLRTPMSVLYSDQDFMREKGRLVREICDDLRVRTKVQGYLKVQTVSPGEDADKKQMEKDAFKALRRAVDHIVEEKLEEDAGYREQYTADAMLMLLLRLFKEGSQGNGQLQSQHDLLQHRHGAELSKTAQRDLKKQKEQDGGWTIG